MHRLRQHLSAHAPTLVLAALFALLPGCEDTGIQVTVPPRTTELGVVVGSVDLSLTIFPVDSPTVTRVVGLGFDGSPVGLAVRDEIAAIPMGIVPALAIVDVASAVLLRSAPLPVGSGATGAAFVNDSTVVVANPGLNSVSAVNVRSGEVGPQIPVGVYPQAVISAGERVLVLNGELESFVPARPGTITVLDGGSLAAIGTIQVSGTNPASAAVSPSGLVYVVNAGAFFAGDGSLSVVDPVALTEVAYHEGFGDFPGAATFGPEGDLYVSSFQYGVAVWDPDLGRFDRSPTDAITPGAVPSVSGLGFDSAGRLYTLRPECVDPSVATRLDAGFDIVATIDVGICPLAIGFTGVASP